MKYIKMKFKRESSLIFMCWIKFKVLEGKEANTLR